MGRTQRHGKVIIARETGLATRSQQASMLLDEEEELDEYKVIKERAQTATSLLGLTLFFLLT